MEQEEESNLVRARPVIVWILAVIVAFAAVGWIEKESARGRVASPPAPATPATPVVPPAAVPGSLPQPR